MQPNKKDLDNIKVLADFARKNWDQPREQELTVYDPVASCKRALQPNLSLSPETVIDLATVAAFEIQRSKQWGIFDAFKARAAHKDTGLSQEMLEKILPLFLSSGIAHDPRAADLLDALYKKGDVAKSAVTNAILRCRLHCEALGYYQDFTLATKDSVKRIYDNETRAMDPGSTWQGNQGRKDSSLVDGLKSEAENVYSQIAENLLALSSGWQLTLDTKNYPLEILLDVWLFILKDKLGVEHATAGDEVAAFLAADSHISQMAREGRLIVAGDEHGTIKRLSKILNLDKSRSKAAKVGDNNWADDSTVTFGCAEAVFLMLAETIAEKLQKTKDSDLAADSLKSYVKNIAENPLRIGGHMERMFLKLAKSDINFPGLISDACERAKSDYNEQSPATEIAPFLQRIKRFSGRIKSLHTRHPRGKGLGRPER